MSLTIAGAPQGQPRYIQSARETRRGQFMDASTKDMANMRLNNIYGRKAADYKARFPTYEKPDVNKLSYRNIKINPKNTAMGYDIRSNWGSRPGAYHPTRTDGTLGDVTAMQQGTGRWSNYPQSTNIYQRQNEAPRYTGADPPPNPRRHYGGFSF